MMGLNSPWGLKVFYRGFSLIPSQFIDMFLSTVTWASFMAIDDEVSIFVAVSE